MTEKAKDRVITLSGSLITSIIVVLVGFSLSAKREDNKDLIYKIDRKVDKIEFEQKCEQIDSRMTTIETIQNETLKEISKAMQQLSTQSATMQNDIAWIKREIDQKGK